MSMGWYLVRTQGGDEHEAGAALQERVTKLGKGGQVGQILVPTRSGGGNLLVQMEPDEALFDLVRKTPWVLNLRGGRTPRPLDEGELLMMTEGAISPRRAVKEGQTVRVIAGPFAGFSGTVERVMPDLKRLRVMVSLTGRATEVEVAFSEVEPA